VVLVLLKTGFEVWVGALLGGKPFEGLFALGNEGQPL
jgi:hypothetical protein